MSIYFDLQVVEKDAKKKKFIILSVDLEKVQDFYVLILDVQKDLYILFLDLKKRILNYNILFVDLVKPQNF